MYSTQTNIIKNLTKTEYSILKELCTYSNNLYNYALYQVRKYYSETGKYLRYYNNYHICKNNENYKMLQANLGQEVIKAVDKSYESFFSAIKLKGNNIRPPMFHDKGGLYNLIIPHNAVFIKNGYINVPISMNYRKTHDYHDKIKIPFPKRLEDKEIYIVRIIPTHSYFKIQYVYEEPNININLNFNNYMAIDFGVDNLATCVSNVESPFIIDGKRLKSINQYWNKEMSRLNHNTKKMNQLSFKRDNCVRDYILKTARYIINNCIEHEIGHVIVGYNKGFKQNSHMGKINNQNFVQIPLYKLRQQLKLLCCRYGIEYIEVEESYTSKSSFLDNDPLPSYTDKTHNKFSGKRISRGLYRSKDGTILNADVNGAFNILRKSKQDFNKEELCSGALGSPIRVKIL